MPLDRNLRAYLETFAPTSNQRFTRRQAPEGEVSSSVAGVRHEAPEASSQHTSAMDHSEFLGSRTAGGIAASCPRFCVSRPSIPSVSAEDVDEFSYFWVPSREGVLQPADRPQTPAFQEKRRIKPLAARSGETNRKG